LRSTTNSTVLISASANRYPLRTLGGTDMGTGLTRSSRATQEGVAVAPHASNGRGRRIVAVGVERVGAGTPEDVREVDVDDCWLSVVSLRRECKHRLQGHDH
jgi:hypothetical protein